MNRVKKLPRSADLDDHSSMTEAYYVLSGVGTTGLDGETREITAGDLVVPDPATWHTSDGVTDVLIRGVPAGERTDSWSA